MIGRIITDLAPTPQNRRNSEGAFINLKNGDILFAYSRYGEEGYQDGCSADIYACVSSDNGETFGEPFLLYAKDTVDTDNVMSVSLMRMQNGDLGMFFLKKIGGLHCMPMLVRSTDEGKSWSDPVNCVDEPGYYVVNNDRVIRTKSGRIISVAAMHGVTSVEAVNGRPQAKGVAPGKLYVFGSDDDGVTWKTLARDILLPPVRFCTTGVQEPGVIELSDGRLWCYIRNNSGRIFECFSSDGGATWTEPQPSWFTSPRSPMSVKRLVDGRLLAVWNPIPMYNGLSNMVKGAFMDGRTPFVLSILDENGPKFTEVKTVENDPESGYCYTAIHETADGAVLLGYCAGSVEDGCCLNRLRIRKIPISEL